MRVAVHDIEMEVDVAGQQGPGRPDVLLVHGLGGSRLVWEPVRELLADSLRVFVPDLRGCGDSTRGTAPWTLAQAAADLAALARELGLARYVAVGHSLGGVLVEELLVRHAAPIAGAALLSTSSRLSEKATQNWRRIADTVEARGLSGSPAAHARGFSEDFARDHGDVVERYAALASGADPGVYAEQARAASSYDYTEGLADVRCPVLVVQGLADRLTPVGGSVLLHRALPSARLELLDGAGHNLPIEVPGRVAGLLRDFALECTDAARG